MSSQTWLPFIFIILTNLSALVTAKNYGCFDSGNYTSNSTYSTNLKTLLSSVSSNMDNSGFYNASMGENPDRVYASALCRSDVQLDTCRNCVQNATTELLSLCPNRKQGILWSGNCTLRYSNESMFGIPTNIWYSYVRVAINVISINQFNESLRTLLDDLRPRASLGGSLMKIAAGNRTGPDFQTIFALLQCTPDLSPGDCAVCLKEITKYMCCNNSIDAMRIYVPSCTLQYDIVPFYNITRIEEARAMISVPVSPTPSPPGNGDNNTTRTVIIIVVPLVVCLVVAACLGISLSLGIFLRKRLKKPHEIIENDDEISTVESLQFDFGKIRAATNDFSDANKLGQGGFGAVYKGKLENGQEIAVKRLLRNSGQGDLEFMNEVLLLSKLQHRNLVRLLGFSLEGTERILVYEFAQNASLDRFIFDPIRRIHIDWDRRHKIIKGIAKGLLYLHEDSRFRIIHRDLKASNIILDGEMNPKIADFGMARLFVLDESEVSTSRIVGTYGYMAPEYAVLGQISVKIDVFSFGVLVLEIVSGKKSNSSQNEENVEHMLSFAWKNWCEGTPTNVVDPVLRSTSSSLQDMLRCIHIGLLCVQENAIDRPTMASIAIMLNSFSTTLPVPSRPSFFMSDTSRSGPNTSRALELSKSSEGKFTYSNHLSKNDASVTELYPR